METIADAKEEALQKLSILQHLMTQSLTSLKF
jgi:hypothetical protein